MEIWRVISPVFCSCWAIVGVRFLVRDPVARQWLQTPTQSSGIPTGLDQGQLDAEPEIHMLLRLCNELEQVDREIIPVVLVNKLRYHDEKLLNELLQVKHKADQPVCFQHQD